VLLNWVQGVVKRVMADGTCTLAIGEIGEGRMLRVDQTTSLSIMDLQLVPPVKWDNVKVYNIVILIIKRNKKYAYAGQIE
jgi:hypothetical protein